YEKEIQSRRPLDVQRHSLDEDIDFRAQHWLPADRPAVQCRASVPPIRIVDFVKQAAIENYAADAAFGAVVGSCTTDRKNPVREAAGALGGSVVFDDPDDIGAFFGATDAELALLQRIKSAFDQ